MDKNNNFLKSNASAFIVVIIIIALYLYTNYNKNHKLINEISKTPYEYTGTSMTRKTIDLFPQALIVSSNFVDLVLKRDKKAFDMITESSKIEIKKTEDTFNDLVDVFSKYGESKGIQFDKVEIYPDIDAGMHVAYVRGSLMYGNNEGYLICLTLLKKDENGDWKVGDISTTCSKDIPQFGNF